MTVQQSHEARRLDGGLINWNSPPAATTKVKWSKASMYGHAVTGSFRHICHLNRLNNLAIKKFGVGITIIQTAYNASVSASAGTHDLDAVVDIYIPGVGWWAQQRFFRANGLPGWYRHPPSFTNHYHGFTLPPHEGTNFSDDFRSAGFKVGVYVDGGYSTRGALVTSSQIADIYNRAFGLSNMHTPGSDNTWWPKNIAATAFDLRRYVQARAA